MRKLLLILLTFVLVSCSPKEYGENLDKQTKNIESYMPKLRYGKQSGVYVTTGEGGAVIPYNKQSGVYVAVIEAGEVGAAVPVFGDIISFNYVERSFTNEPSVFISTNIKSVAEQVGLNTPDDFLIPIEIEWGVTPIIPGLKGALMWATKGEILLAVMPFNLGYDDEWNNIVPPYTALAFDIQIVDIKKKNEK